jgi:hypothetical protein
MTKAPSAEERREFELRLQEITLGELQRMADEYGRDAAMRLASRFRSHDTFRVLSLVTMDRATDQPVPGGLWLEVDVLLPESDVWLPFYQVNAAAAGMSPQYERYQAETTMLQQGMGIPDDLSGLELIDPDIELGDPEDPDVDEDGGQ